jgi:hypothetical protein
MFKYWKEDRENKRLLLQYTTFLLGELSNVVYNYKKSQETAKESGITEKEAVDIMKKIKDLDQKELISVIVDAIKSKSGE